MLSKRKLIDSTKYKLNIIFISLNVYFYLSFSHIKKFFFNFSKNFYCVEKILFFTSFFLSYAKKFFLKHVIKYETNFKHYNHTFFVIVNYKYC